MRKTSIEEIKRRKNGLDVWSDIERYAVTGYESLDAEDLDLFRWYGIYEQRPKRGLFMVRARVPGGMLTARQASRVAQASRDLALGTLDITTRQDLQLHSVALRNLPELVRRLHEVGLSTTFACGDTPRNVVACPLSGRLPGVPLDARAVVRNVERRLAGNRLLANLPRKLKAAVCTCPTQCTIPQIHDVAFYSPIPTKGERMRAGFNLLIGGGLGTRFLPALPIDAWIEPDQVPTVTEAIARLYAEQGPRESRSRARLRHLIRDWSPAVFRERLCQTLGHSLAPGEPDELSGAIFREHLGPLDQAPDGMQVLPLYSAAGKLAPEDLFVAATVSESYGSGQLLLTPMQNLLIPDVPVAEVDAAMDHLQLAPTMSARATYERIGTVSCTGAEYCELALAETKSLAGHLVDQMERARVSSPVPLKIALSGCPNDCAQAQIADIGLIGALSRGADADGDLFDIVAGARLGVDAAAGRVLRAKVPSEQVGREVAALVEGFTAGRRGEESFGSFARRLLDSPAGEFQI